MTRSKLAAKVFTKRYGMGIGLSIVRSTIPSHDGGLAATNVEGGGACVHFSLPTFAKGKQNETNRYIQGQGDRMGRAGRTRVRGG
jgi:K+-sensing histidine kinase KdpD